MVENVMGQLVLQLYLKEIEYCILARSNLRDDTVQTCVSKTLLFTSACRSFGYFKAFFFPRSSYNF